MDWLKTCRKISKRVREKVLAEYGTDEAEEVVKIGAGGDRTIKADVDSENIVLEELERIGDMLIVSEEFGEKTIGNPNCVVVVDPIDGSFNYKKGVGKFALSIAVLKNRSVSSLEFGYIIDLTTGDEYYAHRGSGTYKNGKKIVREKGEGLLLEAQSNRSLEDIKGILDDIMEYKRIRDFGCASLSSCYLAQGLFKKFVYIGKARVLDVIAGKIIVEEAGGRVVGFTEKVGINERTKVEMWA